MVLGENVAPHAGTEPARAPGSVRGSRAAMGAAVANALGPAAVVLKGPTLLTEETDLAVARSTRVLRGWA